MTHLLLPSTVTRKLLIAQASYCRITKLRARLTPKCKKLNIRKCGIVPGFCRSGHILHGKTAMLVLLGYFDRFTDLVLQVPDFFVISIAVTNLLASKEFLDKIAIIPKAII